MAITVVLVEPDERQRAEFVAAIKGSAFEVSGFANSNTEGVELCGKVSPDILVLRLVCENVGAAAVLRLLHKKHPKIKAVVSYDAQSTYLLMTAYARGAVAAIKWPFRHRRVVEKLTFAVASETHEKLQGPIIQLEHPIRVRYKTGGVFSRQRVGFCERLGLTDMDLNVAKKAPKLKSTVKLKLLLPPPDGAQEFIGVVEDGEATGLASTCCHISLKSVTKDAQRLIGSFLAKAARRDRYAFRRQGRSTVLQTNRPVTAPQPSPRGMKRTGTKVSDATTGAVSGRNSKRAVTPTHA